MLMLGLFCSGGIFALMLQLPVYAPHRTPSAVVFSRQEAISLPEIVPGTDLVAERVMLYEGPFVEDGSDRPVVDIMALLVCNTGSCTQYHVQITLYGQSRYVFSADTVPPGARVLLLEETGKQGKEDTFTGLSGTVGTVQTRLSAPVTVTELGMGTLRLENGTDRTLENLIVCHKGYYAEEDFYIGGITYQTSLEALEPGQCADIYPYHYASGYSCVTEVYEE